MPPPQPVPAWLEAFGRFLADLFRPIGRLLKWVGGFFPDAPYARMMLWSVLAAAFAALVFILYRQLRHGGWRGRKPTLAKTEGEQEDWRPQAAPVRAWLEEADALACDGRFAEAIHSLLRRSIEDMAKHRPQLVRPSLTGRELASSALVPERARSLFAGIALVVERSLFGRRPVEEAEWVEARRSYTQFALAEAWQ